MRTWTLMLALVGCAGDGHTDDPVPDPDPTDCDVADAVFGERACVHAVPDVATFESLAIGPVGAKVTKYLVPATDDARVPTLVMDVHTVTLHFDLLSRGFADRYPALSPREYLALITVPDERELYAGSLVQAVDDDGIWIGFNVLESADQPAPGLADVTAVWDALHDEPGLPRLAYVPDTPRQAEAAATWTDAPFPIRGLSPVDYEVYTRGVSFGTARVYSPAELAEATVDVAYGWRDILVLDEAPFDVERVIAGAVTGTRQGLLSHLNVRSAGRGTPNCYVPDPREAFAGFEDQLVRVECGDDALSVRTATLAEAEAWWDTFRPDPLEIPKPDLDHTEIVGLLELDVATPEARALAVRRYGAKGSNLALLYRHVPTGRQLDGFLVPVHYSDRFLRTATWTVDLGDGPGEHTFYDTVQAWLADEAFLADAKLRRERLIALEDAIRDRELLVDDALVDALAAEIRATFGDARTMVRFRSSANAEDALGFTGAGLYESTQACLADELDGDDVGPSLCDPAEPKERTLRRALLKVWASVYGVRAWEEREWFGIDHADVAMGVLVNTRSKDERADIVAFTGDPTAEDDRVLINAQVGDLDVVTSEPGVYPEVTRVEVDASGSVVRIERLRGSSELPSGEHVLDDAQVSAIATDLARLRRDLPVDHPIPDGRTLLLDTEWKVLADGRLIVKQVRPFLR